MIDNNEKQNQLKETNFFLNVLEGKIPVHIAIAYCRERIKELA